MRVQTANILLACWPEPSKTHLIVAGRLVSMPPPASRGQLLRIASPYIIMHCIALSETLQVCCCDFCMVVQMTVDLTGSPCPTIHRGSLGLLSMSMHAPPSDQAPVSPSAVTHQIPVHLMSQSASNMHLCLASHCTNIQNTIPV
jgi:hypothetical protein